MPKLTETFVKKILPPESGNRILYDDDIKGFGIRVTAKGARSFVLNYSIARRERRITIGQFPAWSVAAARDHVKELRKAVDRGEDPLATRDEARRGDTIADLIDDFEKDHLPKLRPGTREEYVRHIKANIRPTLGPLKADAVRRADIAALHRKVSKESPYAANRMLATASVIFNYAIKMERLDRNPCQGIDKNPEHRRERFLSAPEIAALSDALNELDGQSANVIRFLMLTGARRGEVLKARWQQFDLDTGVWSKPAATTKQKKIHRVPLSPPAIELLAGIRKSSDSPWVFPGTNDQPQVNVKRFWQKARERATIILWERQPDTPQGKLVADLKTSFNRTPEFNEIERAAEAVEIELPAGLTDVRIHDLRHSFASLLVARGASLPIIGALLGHTRTETTARYAHLADDPLRAATELVGQALLASNQEKTSDNVVSIRK